MNNVQILAQIFSDCFETKKRDNGESFVCLNDTKLEWMTDIVDDAHMDNFPNDFAYNVVYRVVEALANDENPDIDNMLPAYTHELAEIADRYSEYIDEALREAQPQNYFNLLAYANYLYYGEVLNIVVEGLTAVLDDLGFDPQDDDFKASDLE